MTAEERVLEVYYERVTAYQVDKSRVIAIEFQSKDPELAARVANTIAETYLTLQQVAKQDQARAAGQWLPGEIDKLRAKVWRPRKRSGSSAPSRTCLSAPTTPACRTSSLTEVNSQLSAAQAQKADAETRARLIREQLSSGQPIESSDITNSELIRRLSEQRVTLRAQLAEQSSTLLPQHPRIKELRAQIADLDRQIRTEGEGLARSLENDAKVAGARVETLTADLDRLKRQAASTSDQDVQLRALEREAKAQRDLFESYLAKYREASARDSIAAAPADARIISRAVVSTVPYFPKKGPIIVIAALAMFCLSTAFVATNALSAATHSARRRRNSMRHRSRPGARGDGWPALPAPAAQPASAADAGDRITRSQPRSATPGRAAAGSRSWAAGARWKPPWRRLHSLVRWRATCAWCWWTSPLPRPTSMLLPAGRRRPELPIWCAAPHRSATSSRATGSRARTWWSLEVFAAILLVWSQMLISAVDALSQSYDYLVLDVGAQMDVAPGLAGSVRAARGAGRGRRIRKCNRCPVANG